MSEQAQAEVIPSLPGRTYPPGHAPVEVIRTHRTAVFLSGANAYKIKRDMCYDDLDFPTLQNRHEMLLRALELNAPTAPSIYRDVSAVTRDADGRLHLRGEGEVVECVLRLHGFDAADELDKATDSGVLDDRIAATLDEVIAQYHVKARPRMDISDPDLIDSILEELKTAFAAKTGDFGADQVGRYQTTTDHVFRNVRATLNACGPDGHVRRCHGDLHLHNIVPVDGVWGPLDVPLDALEFDEILGARPAPVVSTAPGRRICAATLSARRRFCVSPLTRLPQSASGSKVMCARPRLAPSPGRQARGFAAFGWSQTCQVLAARVRSRRRDASGSPKDTCFKVQSRLFAPAKPETSSQESTGRHHA